MLQQEYILLSTLPKALLDILPPAKRSESQITREEFDDLLDLLVEETGWDGNDGPKITYGQKLADKVAEFGGSWTFIGIFMSVLIVWMIINSVMLMAKPFDPYPFILLNLVLSCIAALQAPVIMMSQNRQEEEDRRRAKDDLKINIKAEVEIRMLHEKIDRLLENNTK